MKIAALFGLLAAICLSGCTEYVWTYDQAGRLVGECKVEHDIFAHQSACLGVAGQPPASVALPLPGTAQK